MELMHFSGTPVELDRTRTYPQLTGRRAASVFTKPRGLWLSDESDYGWREWCMDEQFRTGEHQHAYRVTLRLGDGGRSVLMLMTVDAVRAFTGQYGFQDRFGVGIRWADVCTDWAGVMITPYQWSLRMNLDWYYGWDVASGCVWDLSVIHTWEPVNTLELEA